MEELSDPRGLRARVSCLPHAVVGGCQQLAICFIAEFVRCHECLQKCLLHEILGIGSVVSVADRITFKITRKRQDVSLETT
jgi:hypothetical protein